MINHLSNIIFLLSSFVFSIFRSIITAGHCICDAMTDERFLPRCLPNFDKKNPSNQIIPGRDIFYVVGQRIVDDRLISGDISKIKTLLYNLPRAEKAFVYENNRYHVQTIHGKRKLRLSIDIGLILTTANIDPNIVECPIELPEKV